jgi:hypothetical protein
MMKWIIPVIAATAMAALSLSIPASVFTTEASASRMDGKGNCAGGDAPAKKHPNKAKQKDKTNPIRGRCG